MIKFLISANLNQNCPQLRTGELIESGNFRKFFSNERTLGTNLRKNRKRMTGQLLITLLMLLWEILISLISFLLNNLAFRNDSWSVTIC